MSEDGVPAKLERLEHNRDMWKAQCEQQAKDLTRISADYNAAIDLAELAEAETDGMRAATDEAFAWANKTVREHEAALALTTSAAIKAEDERDAAIAELDAIAAAFGPRHQFLDPPDGGDVPLSEQVTRMGAALDEAERKRDAAILARGEAIAQCVAMARELGELEGKAGVMEFVGVLDDWREKCTALEAERDAALAEDARLRDALDKIFSLIAYVNIHGVGAQPEPSGEPQVMRVPPDEFRRIWTEIGDTARAALEAKS